MLFVKYFLQGGGSGCIFRNYLQNEMLMCADCRFYAFVCVAFSATNAHPNNRRYKNLFG